MSIQILDINNSIGIIKGLRKLKKDGLCFYSSKKHLRFFEPFQFNGLLELENFIIHLYYKNSNTYQNRYNDFWNINEYKINNESYQTNESFNIYQVYKSLECLKYNSDLSDNENKIIDSLLHDLSKHIIHNLTEYKTSTWG